MGAKVSLTYEKSGIDLRKRIIIIIINEHFTYVLKKPLIECKVL